MSSSIANADTKLVNTPIKVNTADMEEWKTSILTKINELIEQDVKNFPNDAIGPNPDYYPTTGITECRKVQQLNGVYICLSEENDTMNQIFNRISTYAEGGISCETGTPIERKNQAALPKLV